MTHSSEEDEWLMHRINSWVETYKKSMLTPVILSLVSQHQPVTVAELAGKISETTGWELTERGLYRTIKRLQDSGLLTTDDVDAPRTGAKRKEISISALGIGLLEGISHNMVTLPQGLFTSGG
ncbi:MAG: PadR family transcriptional regulator [Ancrocorticia sp.]